MGFDKLEMPTEEEFEYSEMGEEAEEESSENPLAKFSDEELMEELAKRSEGENPEELSFDDEEDMA